MRGLSQYSFTVQICICMLFALLLNLGFGLMLKLKLSNDNYILSIDIDYDEKSTLDLYFDTGSSFNQTQKVTTSVNKGANVLDLGFQLKSEDQLKFIRLDFGDDPKLSNVQINSLKLSSGKDTLFSLKTEEIFGLVGFFKDIKKPVKENGTLNLDVSVQPFDPYIVFKPINELMYPLWKRTILLILPWICCLILPLYKWIYLRVKQKEITLLLAALFIFTIPLKTAWITFTALLLLIFSISEFIMVRRFNPNSNLYLIASLFLVPLLFFGNGQPSKLSIPLAFIIFPVICSIKDFSAILVALKKTYTTVFIVFVSILIVACITLLCYNGYYYNIEASSFFMNLKSNRHQLLYWIYYDHTTFLSFFLLIGQIFAVELNNKKQISKNYYLLYSLFATIGILLLGSRFALGVGLLVVVLTLFSTKTLSKILLPLWMFILGVIVFFIGSVDQFRAKLWSISWDKGNESFWFGHGTGNSNKILPENLPIQRSGELILMDINHSHNQYLTYLLENGFIAACVGMVILLLILNRFGLQKNKSLMLVMFVIMMLTIIESPFKTSTPVYVISFLVSVFSLNFRSPSISNSNK